MFAFLGLNKYVSYGIAIILALSILTGMYFVWKANVEHVALLEYNQQQLEMTIRDQQEFVRQQTEISARQQAATRTLLEQNRQLNNRVDTTTRFLNSPETQRADRPASDILKQTIEQLRQGATP